MKDIFNLQYPHATFLTFKNPEVLIGVLLENHWLGADEAVLKIEKPGEGNMNFVARVTTNKRSLIIKQARPWVEKYPHVPAPVSRVKIEAEFYNVLKGDPFYARYCPEIKGFDERNFTLALEDLGDSVDFTSIYKEKSLLPEDVKNLVAFISHLHNNTKPIHFPDNKELKTLNHNHIFHYPYQESNGFNLDNIQPGLQSLALKYKRNAQLKTKLEHLGQIYLGNGDTLIHGDYYPGSWLKTPQGVRIIDPEFSHLGKAEYDVGVMIAHFKMARIELSQQQEAIGYYKKPANFNDRLFVEFCAAEIMRRLIGLAQLPLDLSLSEKESLLDWAENAITNPVHYAL